MSYWGFRKNEILNKHEVWNEKLKKIKRIEEFEKLNNSVKENGLIIVSKKNGKQIKIISKQKKEEKIKFIIKEENIEKIIKVNKIHRNFCIEEEGIPSEKTSNII